MIKNERLYVFNIFLILSVLFFSFSNVYAEKIKVGSSDVTSSAGLFLAKEKGYFKDFGLDVDIILIKGSGATMTTLLAKNQLDVGGGNITSGLWNAIGEGLQIRVVADKGSIQKENSYIHLLVRSDHLKSGRYKSYKDLKGFKMALTANDGVSQQIVADKFLKAGGLKLNDVTFLKMSYVEMNVGLKTKSIDATIQLEPYSTEAEIDGFGVKVAGAHTVYPGQPSAAIFFSPHFATDRHDDGVKFIAAYLKGVRDYNNAYATGLGKTEMISHLKKYIKIESSEVWEKMNPAGLNPDGFISSDALKSDFSWYMANGYLHKAPPIDKLVDHSFVNGALALIGKNK